MVNLQLFRELSNVPVDSAVEPDLLAGLSELCCSLSYRPGLPYAQGSQLINKFSDRCFVIGIIAIEQRYGFWKCNRNERRSKMGFLGLHIFKKILTVFLHMQIQAYTTPKKTLPFPYIRGQKVVVARVVGGVKLAILA